MLMASVNPFRCLVLPFCECLSAAMQKHWTFLGVNAEVTRSQGLANKCGYSLRLSLSQPSPLSGYRVGARTEVPLSEPWELLKGDVAVFGRSEGADPDFPNREEEPSVPAEVPDRVEPSELNVPFDPSVPPITPGSAASPPARKS